MIDAVANYLSSALEEVLKRPSVSAVSKVDNLPTIILLSGKIKIEIIRRRYSNYKIRYIINHAWLLGNIWSKQYISGYKWATLDLTNHNNVIDALSKTIDAVRNGIND